MATTITTCIVEGATIVSVVPVQRMTPWRWSETIEWWAAALGGNRRRAKTTWLLCPGSRWASKHQRWTSIRRIAITTMERSTFKLPFFLVSLREILFDEVISYYSYHITCWFAGTLADLKKHRAQSRFTQGAITNGNGNGSLTPSEVIAATTTTNGGGSIVTATTTTNGYDDMDGQVTGKIPIELSLISAEDHYQSNGTAGAGGGSGTVNLGNGSTKFSGIITGDVVDSTHSKRCCIVMWMFINYLQLWKAIR